MTIDDLPKVNATLNGISAILITAGWFNIKYDRKQQHIFCMCAALVTSTLFLACYLTYHFIAGVHRFPDLGWIRKFYYVLLGSHVILAFVTLPLVILTVIPALRARFDKHRQIARWTLPIWLYVSITGVLVYMMLYQWFAPAIAGLPVK